MSVRMMGGWVVILAVGLASSTVALEAQRGGRGGGVRGIPPAGARGAAGVGNRRMELENQVWRTHQDQVARALQLAPAASLRYREVSQQFRRRRSELLLEEWSLRQRYRTALQGGAGAELSLEVIRSRLMLADREAALIREETDSLLLFMEPAQVLRLFERRQVFSEQIRRLQSGGARSAGGGGVGLPGGLGGGIGR